LADDPIVFAAELFTSIGVILASIIFARLAYKSKGFGTFQFQLSVFILVWAGSELPHIFGTMGLIDETAYQTVGLTFHFISMAIFALFVGTRSFRYFGGHSKPQPPPFPQTSVSPIKPRGMSD
jgi:hypothetical protein